VTIFVYGDRSESVTALLSAITTDSGSGGDLIIALRGMNGRGLDDPEAHFSRAATIVVSEDESELLAAAQASGNIVHTFGLSASAEFHGSAIECDIDGTVFTLTHGNERYRVSTGLLGEHQVIGVLAAITAASLLGVELTTAIAAVRTPDFVERWFMQPLRAPSGALVINDALEATKNSTASSLKALALLTVDGSRSVAVLGELDALPTEALDDHDSIGRLVVRLNIKKLVVVGHAARHIQVAAGLEGSWDGESVLVQTPEEAYDLLSEELGDGDVVLVKSSSAAGLRFFGDKLGRH